MCIRTLKENESYLKTRCACCHGVKSAKRTSWYCAKCDRRIKSSIRKSVKTWAAKTKA